MRNMINEAGVSISLHVSQALLNMIEGAAALNSRAIQEELVERILGSFGVDAKIYPAYLVKKDNLGKVK